MVCQRLPIPGGSEDLALENLALRQPLLALHAKRPRRRWTALHPLAGIGYEDPSGRGGRSLSAGSLLEPSCAGSGLASGHIGLGFQAPDQWMVTASQLSSDNFSLSVSSRIISIRTASNSSGFFFTGSADEALLFALEFRWPIWARMTHGTTSRPSEFCEALQRLRQTMSGDASLAGAMPYAMPAEGLY
jgi:hypothetical protein